MRSILIYILPELFCVNVDEGL